MVQSSPDQNDKLIKLLEEQLKQSNRQIEALTEQVRHLTKVLYGSKTEQSKYNRGRISELGRGISYLRK